jgi:hypothetical protein
MVYLMIEFAAILKATVISSKQINRSQSSGNLTMLFSVRLIIFKKPAQPITGRVDFGV